MGMVMNETLGTALGRSHYTPEPGVIGRIQNTGVGRNTILEVGKWLSEEPWEQPRADRGPNGSWFKTGHIVLAPEERAELIGILVSHSTPEERDRLIATLTAQREG